MRRELPGDEDEQQTLKRIAFYGARIVRATFDHALYCQPHGDQHLALGSKWEESTSHARRFMKLDKSKSIIEPDQHCYRRELRGSLKNQDTFISVAA